MKALILKLGIGIVFVGTLAVGINTFFGYNTVTYLEKIRIVGDMWYYKFDTWRYIEGVNDFFSNPNILSLDIPEFNRWNWGTDIFSINNNLTIMLNTVIFAINVFLYPLRIGAWTVMFLMQVLGINMSNPPTDSGIYWFYQFMYTLRELQIPLVAM